jgi:ribosomal protein S18 acetylase RimI-like enzyme
MIRLANKNDVDRIAEIELFVSRYNFKDIFPNDFLYKKLTYEYHKDWLTNSFTNMENDRGIEIYVFDEENIIKGYISIGYPVNSNECELTNIRIDVPFQNNGFGTLLLNYCLELIKNRERNILKLNVFEKNSMAIKFYEKNGFKKENKYFSEELGIDFLRYKKNI